MPTTGITMLSTVLASGVLAVVASDARAQSRCGASYEVAVGDTLYSISQACRVSLARIMDLNPGLGNPRDISVGQDLRLVAGTQSAPGGSAGRDGRRYEVREGDTLNDIATRFGVSVFELIAQNGDFDPSELDVGQVIGIPGDGPDGTVSITPRSGTSGSMITVEAEGLRPNDYVTIGAGPRAAEWKSLREIQTGSDGALRARVPLPDHADPGDVFIFVVDTDRGVTFKSEPFDVVAEAPTQMTLEGRVEDGVECPVLVTRDGDRYALAGSNPPVTVGEYVEISGVRDPSYCAEGLTTVDVYDIEEVTPPGDGGDDGNGMTLEGRVRSGVECPVLVTPDGDRYALAGDEPPVTIGEYVEITADKVEMSFCMEGRATLDVTDLREVSPPARDRDPDRAGGVALTRDYMIGAWTAKGSDCTRPDFDVTRTPTGALTVETSLNGAPRTGFVALGDDPAFIFDQPRREFDLESRGPDGVAVMPPSGGAVRLGGRDISGDGVVYVSCG